MQEYLLVAFLVFGVLQLLFLLIYFFAIAFYKNPAKSGAPVSVIVCARNEYENLKRNLPVLLEQEYSNYEIIVVNDRSGDETYDYLMEMKAKHPHLKVVQVDEVPDHINSKKYAIILGVKAAKNEKLLFTDADCQPASNRWIEEMAIKKEFALGVSLYKKQKGLLNLFIRFETYITAIQYIANGILRNPYMGVGRNLSYPKSTFISNNGFGRLQGVLGGDDDLFVNQHAKGRNTGVIVGKDALVYTEAKTSLRDFMIQKKRHLSVGKYYRVTDKIMLGTFSISYILFWVLGAVLVIFEPYVVLIGFISRFFVLHLLFYIASKRFGERFTPLVIPVLDFLYVIYYISAGTSASFSKRTKWS